MDLNYSLIIDEYFSTKMEVFTVDDCYKHLKSRGVKITKKQVFDLLNTSSKIFPLINQEYMTRAAVFTGKVFSFKPSKEEVRKGQILIGHRCMPFVNPELDPDKITVKVNGKIIESQSAVFSMNLAMDVFALFGEGYVIPYIFNDDANTKIQMSSLQYGLPSEIRLTSWPLSEITEGEKFNYGDRIICKVEDWVQHIVEFGVLKPEDESCISNADFEREEWYSIFEKGLLNDFDKWGPCNSIEEQLATLYMENQDELCINNCGSVEEFLQHTRKIGFSNYGVESRIWRVGETVPYIGPWNDAESTEALFSDMSLIFTPYVIEAYLENHIYERENKINNQSFEELVDTIFPLSLKMPTAERKLILLNIEKRNDIIEKQYNQFSDYKIAPLRHRVIALFSQVSSLLCSIGCSGLKLEDFPQQELVVLTQLFNHTERIIEEIENVFMRDFFPIDDVELSLTGMEETFDEIVGTLQSSLEINTYKNIKILE
ncbi:MAG: hypothetical protein MJ188_04740 [Treponema sp.]|nr:hypothetical protein [Treponema sp.]